MKAKVLFFDIETTPNIGYTWGKYEQDVIDFKQEWQLLSFAWKWDFGSTTYCESRRLNSEKELVQKLWNLLNNADIVVAHNGQDFDVKKAKAKFIEYGLKPPSPFKVVDTKLVARAQFKFNSNSLNDLGKILKLGKKVETGGFQLWLDCMAGKEKALRKMERYNKQDVVLLEKVYNKLRSWHTSHPSLSLLEGRPGCPACGSKHTQKRGYTINVKSKAERLQCQDCGHWSTGKRVTR